MFGFRFGGSKESVKPKAQEEVDDLESLQKSNQESRAFFESVSLIAKELLTHQSEILKLGQRLEDALVSQSKTSKELADSFRVVSQLQSDINKRQSKLVEITQSHFVQPITSIIEKDAKTVDTTRAQYLASRREHESLTKVDRSSKNLVAIDYSSVVQRYETYRSDYQNASTALDTSSKLKAVEAIVEYNKSQSAILQEKVDVYNKFKLPGNVQFASAVPSNPPEVRAVTESQLGQSIRRESTQLLPPNVRSPSIASLPPAVIQQTNASVAQQRTSSVYTRNAALLKSVRIDSTHITESSKTSLPEIDIGLDEEQYSLATYESYLLLNKYPFEHPEKWDESDELHQEMRIYFQISKKQFSRVIGWLKAPYAPFKPVYRPELLYYRFHLVKTLESSAFDKEEDYKLWRERQLKIFQAGIAYIVRLDESKWKSGDIKMTADEVVEAIETYISDAISASIRSTEHVAILSEFLEKLFKNSPYVVRSGQHDLLEIPYPEALVATLYSTMIGVIYDQDSKTLNSATPQLLEKFNRMRRIADIDDATHSACVLKTLVEVLLQTGESNEDFEEILKAQTDALLAAVQSGKKGVGLQIVAEKLESSLGEAVLDFFQTMLHTPKLLSSYFPILVGLRCGRTRATPEAESASIIQEAARTHYARLKETALGEEETLPIFAKLGKSISEECEYALETYTSQMSGVFDEADICLVLSFAVRYYDDFMANYDTAKVNQKTAPHFVEIKEFSDFVCEKVSEFKSIDLEELFRAWFQRWLKEQETMFSDYSSRIMKAENWKPIGRDCNVSAVIDLSSMLSQYVDVYRGLSIFSGTPLVEFAKMIQVSVDTFTSHLSTSLIPRNELVAEKVKLLPLFVQPQSKLNPIKRVGFSKLSDSVIGKLKAADINAVSIRAQSAIHMSTEVQKLMTDLENQIHEAGEGSDVDVYIKEIKRYHEATNKKLQSVYNSLVEFIATRIIFFDLRDEFLHGLYLPIPNEMQMSPIIDGIHTIVENVGKLGLPASFMDSLTSAIRKEFFICLELVIFDLDPQRKYFPETEKAKSSPASSRRPIEEIFDENIEEAITYFYGKADYLLQGQWSARTSLFANSPKELVDLFKTAKKDNDRELMEDLAHLIVTCEGQETKSFLRSLKLAA